VCFIFIELVVQRNRDSLGVVLFVALVSYVCSIVIGIGAGIKPVRLSIHGLIGLTSWTAGSKWCNIIYIYN